MNNEQVKAKCIGMDEEGKGIVKIGGREFHIPYLITGETAVIELYGKKGHMNTRLIRIDEKSKSRVSPECPYYDQCGGCQMQHLSYTGQSEFKQQRVEKLLKRYQKVNKILSMKDPYFYRNKIHSTLSYSPKGEIASGIYQEYTHRVISTEQCIIQDRRADSIIAAIREIMKMFKIKPYNEDTGAGFLRHILIKTGFYSNQIMVVLVVSSNVFPSRKEFINALLKTHPEITTIVMNVNNRRTSVVLGETEKVLYGNGYIEDTLCGRVFQISPKSFYQVNPVQTEILYNKAIDMAKLRGDETVIDAYSGIGTISLIVSSKVKKVIGVELNKDAVSDAIRNAKRNDIKNTYFYNADAGEFMVNLSRERQKVDVVFMDSPRSGSDEKFLSSLVRLEPEKVIYISCNPATQARDLHYLTQHNYTVEEIQPVDMFPQTFHVETVVLMTNSGLKEK
jgi:23S rRNA (uracil1939-C5)-methyltransferase